MAYCAHAECCLLSRLACISRTNSRVASDLRRGDTLVTSLKCSSSFSILCLTILFTLVSSISFEPHYNDVIMLTMASQITSHKIFYSTAYLGTDKRKHQSSASLAFVQGIHWWPANSPHKGPVTQKISPFDDVIMGHLVQSNLYP